MTYTKGELWRYTIVPNSISLGPISTLISILILKYQGTAVEVGIASALFSAVGIPAAVFWGRLNDTTNKRRAILVVSYASTSLLIFLLFFATTSYQVILIYGALAFTTAASSTPINLLIMETQPKSKWASGFANISLLSSVGNTVGLLLGASWPEALLKFIALALASLSLASAFLAWIFVKEPPITFERRMIIMEKHSFMERLRAFPLIFIRIPRLADFRISFKGLGHELTRKLPLLYTTLVVFYVASGLFNTSIVPALYQKKILEQYVFLVMLAGMTVQTIAYRFSGRYCERRGLKLSAMDGLLLRSTFYALIAVAVYFITGFPLFILSLLFYPVAAGIGFALFYTASNTMVFDSIGVTRRGSSLGVYSALVGIAGTAGSFASGYISFYLGYHITFFVAAALLVLCILLIARIHNDSF
ncbi:MAG: MFS transporter [Nitrososphaerota archaeon]